MKPHLWSSYLFDKTDNNKVTAKTLLYTWNNKLGFHKAEVVPIMFRSADHTHTLGYTRKVYLWEAFGRSQQQGLHWSVSIKAGSPDSHCRLFRRVLNPGWVANGGSHPEQIHLTDLNRHSLTNAWISMELLSATKPKVLLRGQNNTQQERFWCALSWWFRERNIKKSKFNLSLFEKWIMIKKTINKKPQNMCMWFWKVHVQRMTQT